MRNMIEENTKAFDHLVNQLEIGGEFTVDKAKRYIKTDVNEKEWLQKLTIEDRISVLPKTNALLIQFDSVFYVCVIGTNLDSGEYDNLVLVDCPINSGLITLLIAEEHLKLDSKSDELKFFNEVMFQDKDPGYKGHDYKDILVFLEPLNFYSLPEDSALFNKRLERVMCYVFAKNGNQLILNFDEKVLEKIIELSLEGTDSISFSLLLSCLFSTSYRHAFLEIYRLIERLFPISYLKEFHEKSDSKLSFLAFSASLEDITSWRPREEDALEKIFKSSNESTKGYFDSFFSSSTELNSVTRFKYFYKLRNSIVHFRASHEEHKLDDEQWNKIVLATLFLIDEQYRSYHPILSEEHMTHPDQEAVNPDQLSITDPNELNASLTLNS